MTDATAVRVARELQTLGLGPALDALADDAVHDAAEEDSLYCLRWPQVTGASSVPGVGCDQLFGGGDETTLNRRLHLSDECRRCHLSPLDVVLRDP